jgi:hypothetical protein
MKSRLVSSCSTLATALLAFIMFGASRVSAEDLDAIGCLPPTFVAENSAEVSEALELTCLSSRADAQTDIADVAFLSAMAGQATAVEGDQSAAAAPLENDIHLWLDDALSPLAMEGSAISVEVTQSATIASRMLRLSQARCRPLRSPTALSERNAT